MAWEALGRGLAPTSKNGAPVRTGALLTILAFFGEKIDMHGTRARTPFLVISAFWCEAGGSLAHVGVPKGPPLGTLFSTMFVIFGVSSDSLFRSSVLEASGL